GTNWTSQTIGVAADGGQLDAVDCVAVTICQGVGDYDEHVDALRSSAEGRRWTYAELPTVTRLAQVSCPSLAVCEAVGYGAGLVLRTTDGGARWVLQPVPAAAAAYPMGVTCPSTAVC